MIDSGNDPGHYDQEVFLALRDWEPFFTNAEMDTDEQRTAAGRSRRSRPCWTRARMALK